MKLWHLSLVMLLAAGCATPGATRSESLKPVDEATEITSMMQQSCKLVGEVYVDARTKAAALKKMKRQASRMGANQVVVTSMMTGMVSGKIKLAGKAMHCPLTYKGRAEMIIEVEDDTTSKAGDEVSLDPQAVPDSPEIVSAVSSELTRSPEMNNDANPFQ
jgi:uncharacterized protein YbjQ (UPF0145 family)